MRDFPSDSNTHKPHDVAFDDVRFNWYAYRNSVEKRLEKEVLREVIPSEYTLMDVESNGERIACVSRN